MRFAAIAVPGGPDGTMVAPVSGMPDAHSGRSRVHNGAPSVLAGTLLRIGDFLRTYHRHHVRGIDSLRASLLDGDRPVILVGNHCMDVTDPLMLATAIHREIGRLLPAMGHETIFFGLPAVRSFVGSLGVIPSRHPDLARRTLERHGALLLYPGAGAEAALRSYRREPYTLKWYGRLGFVDLALRAGAEIRFVAGVGIDEMYYQTDRPIPDVLFRLVGDTYLEEYRGARIQLGAAGVHVIPGIFPLPVRVTHVISPPLGLDPRTDPDDLYSLEIAQVRIWAECQSHLASAVSARDRDSDWLDRALRRGMHSLERIGL